MGKLTENDLKVKQREEALARLLTLKVHPNVVRDFRDEILNCSEDGILFWLDEEEEGFIKAWEKKTNHMVYHVIKNHMSFGTAYSLLYVSKYESEWELDKEFLADGCPFVYVLNSEGRELSEYGTIGVRPAYGGVLRTQ